MSRTTTSGRLTRERIVAAVTDLLERGGIEAVSTRTVGEALEVHPTALYRHFRDMDELLRDAADRILDHLLDDLPDPETTDALDSVAVLCWRLRHVLMNHPGAARVMAAGPSRMPNERALTEVMLRLLSRAGLPDDEVTRGYHALIEYVVGSAALDTASGIETPTDVEVRHRTWRADYYAASPTEFPETVRLAELLYPSLDEQFRFGLDLMVAGLRRRTPSRAVSRAPGPPIGVAEGDPER